MVDSLTMKHGTLMYHDESSSKRLFCRHSHSISAPSFIVRGPIVSKLQALTPFKSLFCQWLFVVVYKLVKSFDELSSWYISVPSFIVRGQTISKLQAQTQLTSLYCLRMLLFQTFNIYMLLLMVGCMCVQSFITLGISFSYNSQHTLFVSIIMYCLGLFAVVYEDIKMLLHDLSWIPISVQSAYLTRFLRYAC